MTSPIDKEPPIIELAIGAYFQGLEELKIFNIMEFYKDSLLLEYPKIEEKVYLPVSGASIVGTRNNISDMPVFWFLNEDESECVQLHRDRVVFNWRKTSDNDYPSFEKIYPKFTAIFEKFIDKMSSIVEDIIIKKLELTYVNKIEAIGNLKEVFVGFSDFPVLENESISVEQEIVEIEIGCIVSYFIRKRRQSNELFCIISGQGVPTEEMRSNPTEENPPFKLWFDAVHKRLRKKFREESFNASILTQWNLDS